MLFHRFYYNPLAQAAYLIADGDEAVVVDPARDVSEILAFATQHGLKIRWALATHVHADFVAGLGELAAATGASVALGARFEGAMPCDRLEDGREIPIGGVVRYVLETPGHTPESVSFLLRAADVTSPPRLLSGDTMLLGDVGRPDLVAGKGHTPRDMALAMFTSIHERLAPLSDDTEVWPAHGAGSACGTDISCDEFSTIGIQRVGNWALNEKSPEQFCERLIAAQRQPPPYFAHAAALNRCGPTLLSKLRKPVQADREAVLAGLAQGTQLIDVRSREQHATGHWPQALNLGYNGNDFESWAGTLLDADKPIMIHADSAEQAEVARRRLLCIGFDEVRGFTTALPAEPGTHSQLQAAELFTALQHEGDLQVIDVRRPGEFAAGHVPGAVHAQLGRDLAARPTLRGLDRDRQTAVICRSGYRSSAAIQQLAAAGFTSLSNVSDGMLAWTGNHLPVQT